MKTESNRPLTTDETTSLSVLRLGLFRLVASTRARPLISALATLDLAYPPDAQERYWRNATASETPWIPLSDDEADAEVLS